MGSEVALGERYGEGRVGGKVESWVAFSPVSVGVMGQLECPKDWRK